MIELDRVGMVYQTVSGPVEALRNIDLSVAEGEFVSLVGPSGCGKSTLLRVLAGLRPASSGDIVVDGQRVTRPIAKVGMVFQAAVLLKWRTVLENVLLPAELAGLNPKRYRDRARELLKLVGLSGFETKRPGELSGGMQQRVSLCRALLLDPPLLLMDEPFGALDEMTREMMCEWVGDVLLRQPKTVILVTHSIDEAVMLADRIVILAPRPGKIDTIVPVDLPRPRRRSLKTTTEFSNYVMDVRRQLYAVEEARGAA